MSVNNFDEVVYVYNDNIVNLFCIFFLPKTEISNIVYVEFLINTI